MESKVLIKLYKELEKLVDDDEILHDTWRAKNWKARSKNTPLKMSAVGGWKNWEGGVRENLKVKLDRQLELLKHWVHDSNFVLLYIHRLAREYNVVVRHRRTNQIAYKNANITECVYSWFNKGCFGHW